MQDTINIGSNKGFYAENKLPKIYSELMGRDTSGDLNNSISALDFGTYAMSMWGGYGATDGHFSLDYSIEINITEAPVPEPTTIALFSIGLLGLAGITRRKQQ